ncbi:hypothetical protein ABS772_06160 [Methylorubrum podarium]|uniref:Replication initiation protein n=1 Tax=Methylorubrum podarium TaxID=200476 RepID=A0ABV1QJG0_9HYPH
MAYRHSQVISATAPLAAPLAKQPTPIPANSNTPNTPSTTKGKSAQTKGRAKEKTRTKKSRARFHATWEESGELTKLDYINAAGALRGQPFAWTLNLSPDVEQAANDNERGPLDYVSRRVRRHLDREPMLQGAALPLWIVIETTDSGRLHLHGAIFLDNSEFAPAIRRALSRAGGAWDAKAGEEYQTDLAPQRHPDIWAAYPLKRQGRTRRHVRDARALKHDAPVPIATWSRELVADAKRLLEEERRAIGRR